MSQTWNRTLTVFDVDMCVTGFVHLVYNIDYFAEYIPLLF